jgi:outer membrane protein TolC
LRLSCLQLRPSRLLLALSGSLLAGGCVAVPPAPVDLSARATARTTATIDPVAIRAHAAAIAPAAPAREQGQGQGQGPELDRLDLYAAILLLDPKVEQARAAVRTAEKAAAAARKAASPTLSLTSEYSNDGSGSAPWALGAALDLPLDYGARRSARLTRADLAVMAARDDLAETVWSERTALNKGLVDLLAGQMQADLGQTIVAARDAQLATLADRAARGEISGLALFPYRQQRAAAARAADDARTRQATGLAAIAAVLGVPATALARTPLVWPDFARPAAAPSLGGDARRQAISARSDVLKALAAYDQAEADLRGELAKQAPSISIGSGYTWDHGLVKLPFALGLNLPSFDLNRSAIRAAEARRAEAGAAIETALSAAQGAIEAAEAEQAGAFAALARVRTAEVPAAHATAQRTDQRLKLGAIDKAEWAGARIAALEADLAEVDALVRARLAVLALEDALRRPLGGPELAATQTVAPGPGGDK